MEPKTPDRLARAVGFKFALTIAIAFTAVGGVLLAKGRHGGGFLVGVGALAMAAGIAVPTRLGPVVHVWTIVGATMGRLSASLVFGAIFVLVLTPLGILRRTLSRSPIARDASATSYWIRRASSEELEDPARLERQF